MGVVGCFRHSNQQSLTRATFSQIIQGRFRTLLLASFSLVAFAPSAAFSMCEGGDLAKHRRMCERIAETVNFLEDAEFSFSACMSVLPEFTDALERGAEHGELTDDMVYGGDAQQFVQDNVETIAMGLESGEQFTPLQDGPTGSYADLAADLMDTYKDGGPEALLEAIRDLQDRIDQAGEKLEERLRQERWRLGICQLQCSLGSLFESTAGDK